VETDCFSCTQNDASFLPLRDRLWEEPGWSVAHSFNSSLPGWLVLIPRRHVTSLDELTEVESLVVGPLLRRLTSALRRVIGCEKTYVLLLAEAEGFTHLHFHVVPRSAQMPPEMRGVGVFAYLKGVPVDEQAREEISQKIRSALLESKENAPN